MDESLQISGAWMNKYTGDIVRVHNNIIDGDQMILITDKGQINMNEFSDNYIQASEDIYNDQGQIIDHAPVAIDEIKISQPSILDIPIGMTTSNYTQVIKENNTNYQDIKSYLQTNISTYIMELTGRKPIILPIILDIKRSSLQN